MFLEEGSKKVGKCSKEVELPQNEQEQEGSMEIKSQQQLSNRNELGIFTQ